MSTEKKNNAERGKTPAPESTEIQQVQNDPIAQYQKKKEIKPEQGWDMLLGMYGGRP